MVRKLLLRFAAWILSLTHEPVTLDNINKKMIRPVDMPGNGGQLIIDGVEYFEFVNTADMPEGRFVHYQHFRNELNIGMDSTLVNKYFEAMKEANNDKDSSRVGSLIYMMQDTINNCTPVEVLYNLAALVYFDKSEDLSCFDGDYNQRKIELFKKYPNQGFFFTRLLQKGLKNVGTELPEDISLYLTQSAVKLKSFERILSAQKETRTSETLNEL